MNHPLFLTHKVKIESLIKVYDFQIADHLVICENLYSLRCACRHTHFKQKCSFTNDKVCLTCNVPTKQLIKREQLMYHLNPHTILLKCCTHRHEPPCNNCLGCKTNKSCFIKEPFDCNITTDAICKKHGKLSKNIFNQNPHLLQEHIYNTKNPLFYFCDIHKHYHHNDNIKLRNLPCVIHMKPCCDKSIHLLDYKLSFNIIVTTPTIKKNKNNQDLILQQQQKQKLEQFQEEQQQQQLHHQPQQIQKFNKSLSSFALSSLSSHSNDNFNLNNLKFNKSTKTTNSTATLKKAATELKRKILYNHNNHHNNNNNFNFKRQQAFTKTLSSKSISSSTSSIVSDLSLASSSSSTSSLVSKSSSIKSSNSSSVLLATQFKKNKFKLNKNNFIQSNKPIYNTRQKYIIYDPSIWREQSKSHFISTLKCIIYSPDKFDSRYKNFETSTFTIPNIKSYISGKQSFVRLNITGFKTQGIYQTSTISCNLHYTCVLLPQKLYYIAIKYYDLEYVCIKRDPSIKETCVFVCRAIMNPDPNITTIVIPDAIAKPLNQDQDGDTNGVYMLLKKVNKYDTCDSFMYALSKIELRNAFGKKLSLIGKPRYSFSEYNIQMMAVNYNELMERSNFFRKTYSHGIK